MGSWEDLGREGGVGLEEESKGGSMQAHSTPTRAPSYAQLNMVLWLGREPMHPHPSASFTRPWSTLPCSPWVLPLG